MTDATLAIAIPTYQRPDVLRRCLAEVLDDAEALGVAIYISDDSSDADTEAMVADLSQRYPNIHYRHNRPALRHDGNVLQTLLWPEADYVWLLGDARWVKRGQLARIKRFLTGQDMVFVNSHCSDTRTVKAAEGDDALHLARDRLWHQTMTGATIYHRNVIRWAANDIIVKRNFPQISVILGYLSSNPAKIGWFGEPSIGTVDKPSYWQSAMLDVFVDDWVSVVSAFPKVVSPSEMPSVVKAHSANMNLFSRKTLFELKASKRVSWRALRRSHFLDAMHLNKWVVIGILISPIFVVQVAKSVRALSRSRIAIRPPRPAPSSSPVAGW
ncbi:hypothetical protein GCM10011380_14810 [Sphingomonas metalli]|uniref:Glycosyltransferase 2-like domain-containing protein n=1 Tax=Sphingomonas metalli TaxID=1779358 RepID=A0A916WSU6_9SPHN|nr:glycosyltransferase [Sphingomonas metalli]GGB26339.1 hypothetical protein GCM10011380_14810 [Sphingomonas metalli]